MASEDQQPLLAQRDTRRDTGIADETLLSPHKGDHHTHFHLEMSPTIYSTILYAPAVSRIKSGFEISKLARLSIILTIMNMVLQVGLLRIMDIYGQREDQLSMLGMIRNEDDRGTETLKKVNHAFLTPPERDLLDQSDNSPPMCFVDNYGTYSCKPPPVRFTSSWQSLDTNGDGLWTLSEASSSRKLTAEGDPVSVNWRKLLFNDIVHGMMQRADYLKTLNRSLYLSPTLVDMHAIPKAYFEYWVGDAMFCTRYDANSCESIVASGLFDAALARGQLAAAHKGIFDYSTAVKYCQMMLEDSGGCEQSLPNYRQNMLQRRTTCGTVSLRSVGLTADPQNPTDILLVTSPAYSNLSREKHALAGMFLFFKFLILVLFYSSIVDEVRDLIKTGEFIRAFPSLYDNKDRGGIDRGPDHEELGEARRYKIERISPKLRIGIGFIWVLRILIVLLMLRFGTWFLLKELRYVELVLNALALSFITGIDEMIYSTFLEQREQQEAFDDIDPLHFEHSMPSPLTWPGLLFERKCWGLCIIPLAAALLVLWRAYWISMPTLEALTCTCLQEGGRCAESLDNQAEWWQHYWTRTLPAAIHQIEAMRK